MAATTPARYDTATPGGGAGIASTAQSLPSASDSSFQGVGGSDERQRFLNPDGTWLGVAASSDEQWNWTDARGGWRDWNVTGGWANGGWRDPGESHRITSVIPPPPPPHRISSVIPPPPPPPPAPREIVPSTSEINWGDRNGNGGWNSCEWRGPGEKGNVRALGGLSGVALESGDDSANITVEPVPHSRHGKCKRCREWHSPGQLWPCSTLECRHYGRLFCLANRCAPKHCQRHHERNRRRAQRTGQFLAGSAVAAQSPYPGSTPMGHWDSGGQSEHDSCGEVGH